MRKYLIVYADEMDGHAFSGAHYIQTEKDLTDKQKEQIVKMAVSVEDEEIEVQAMPDGEQFYCTSDISMATMSVRIIKLPSRMKKNKMYGVETRTG